MSLVTSQIAQNQPPHTVIIGGGITGLSAAYALEQAGLRYTLIERDTRLGGKIRSDVFDHDGGRFVVEAGPDSLLTQKPWAVELAHELGLAPRMIGSNQRRKTVYVYSRGRIEPMPEGMMLAVPLKLGPFVRSRLLSPLGRLRVLLDMVLPARRDGADESLGSFIRRRMGQEALDRIAEPLMSGIHNAECEQQSLLATFPRFHAVERQHGSLIRHLRAEQRRVVKPSVPSSPFISFKHGLQELVDTLATQLTGQIVTNTGVAAITSNKRGGYQIELDSGDVLHADNIIITTAAPVAAGLLDSLAPTLATALRGIRYVSTATVSLAYRVVDVHVPIDGSGMLVPRVEGRQINALTVTSTKWAERAPDDAVLLRAFVGGSHNPGILELDDTALVDNVRAELSALLGITAEPLFSRVYRWNNANPQYDVGHLERVAAMEQLCPEGITLAGCAYRGVGIPDCIRQGQEAAAQVIDESRRAKLLIPSPQPSPAHGRGLG